MLELKLAKGRVLRWILEGMKCHLTYANFNFSAVGLSLYEQDASGDVSVCLCLPAVCFLSYRCDRNFAMRMNIGNMLKIFWFAGDHDILTIKADDGSEVVTFMFGEHSSFKCETADFETKMTIVDFKSDGIEDRQFETIIRMPSKDFSRICGALYGIGDTVRISVSEDCVQFYSQGDIGCGSISRRKTTQISGLEIEIEMKKPFKFAVDAGYLRSCHLWHTSSMRVVVSTSLDMFLLVDYGVAESGHLRFYFRTKDYYNFD